MGNQESVELRCLTCGTLNRMPRYFRIDQRPKCGRCGALLGTLPATSSPEDVVSAVLVRPRRARRPFVLGALAIAAIGALAWMGSEQHFAALVGKSPNVPPSDLVAPPDECEKVGQPRQGVVATYSNAVPLAPLEIRVDAGVNYFVKLEDASSGAPAMTIFIYGGSRVETDMPLGTYVLKYATGRYWCGEPELFGAGTSTSKVDRALSFVNDGSKYQGHTITLKMMRDGNLSVSRISRKDF